MSEPNPAPVRPLRSEFAGDAEMTDLIALFVREMPARVAALQDLWQRQDLQSLHRAAHQLKGAGGGYGFSPISDAAGSLAQTLHTLGAGSPEASISQLRKDFVELISLCRRASV